MDTAPVDLNFECTGCGACCQNLRLPLSIAEAVVWQAAGHAVQVLCDAIPWPSEPPAGDVHAQNKRRRSFAAASGSMPIRVIVTLVAAFRDGCPNLKDLRCTIYASRPNVCRIYPAEINPFVLPQPAAKACPSEAWAPAMPPFLRGGTLIDAETRLLIEQSRLANETDVGGKQRLCALLGLHTAAMSNEGYAIHAPGPEAMAGALARVRGGEAGPGDAPGSWRFVSDRQPTLDALLDIGAHAVPAEAALANDFEFLSLHPAP